MEEAVFVEPLRVEVNFLSILLGLVGVPEIPPLARVYEALQTLGTVVVSFPSIHHSFCKESFVDSRE